MQFSRGPNRSGEEMTSTRHRRDDPIGRVVAANIRRLRQQEGWSQQQLANRLAPYIGGELSPAAISQWEDGRNADSSVRRFSITELWALCHIFDVNLALLLNPGLWATRIADVPDLFGEPYSSIWADCFASIGPDDYESWERVADVERGTPQAVDRVYQAENGDEKEFSPDELEAAARLLRQSRDEA